MRTDQRWQVVLAVTVTAVLAIPAVAQQPAVSPPAGPAVAKPKPAPRPTGPGAAAVVGGQPKLLGQFGEWGAYAATQGGKKVCFALAKPTSGETSPPNRPRNPAYMFISTRPADKVTNEVSIIIGYPFKSGTEATAEVGSTTFALYTQQDGAWIKNAAEEAHMVEAMRQGQTAVVKGTSTKGTQSTDTYTLKGLAQALDRTGQDCK
jgi:invasion protein IalB